jgi:LuxR family maltose regulon positive regulatory protein
MDSEPTPETLSSEPADSPRQDSPRSPLTARETEILRCLPTRLSINDISSLLNVSPNTVKTHLRRIYSKLGVRSRNEAILMGAKYHLISKQAELLVRH